MRMAWQDGQEGQGRNPHSQGGGGRRRGAWRLLEGGLRRLRDRHDGVLPADVAAERHHRGAAQGPRRLFQSEQRAVAQFVRHRPAVRRPHGILRRRDAVGSRQSAGDGRPATRGRSGRGRRVGRDRPAAAASRRHDKQGTGSGRQTAAEAAAATGAERRSGRAASRRPGHGGARRCATSADRGGAARRNWRGAKSRPSSRRRSRSAKRWATIRNWPSWRASWRST